MGFKILILVIFILIWLFVITAGTDNSDEPNQFDID